MPYCIPGGSSQGQAREQRYIVGLVGAKRVAFLDVGMPVGTASGPQIRRGDQSRQCLLPFVDAAGMKPVDCGEHRCDATHGSEAAIYCRSLNAHLQRDQASSVSGITPM